MHQTDNTAPLIPSSVVKFRGILLPAVQVARRPAWRLAERLPELSPAV